MDARQIGSRSPLSSPGPIRLPSSSRQLRETPRSATGAPPGLERPRGLDKIRVGNRLKKAEKLTNKIPAEPLSALIPLNNLSPPLGSPFWLGCLERCLERWLFGRVSSPKPLDSHSLERRRTRSFPVESSRGAGLQSAVHDSPPVMEAPKWANELADGSSGCRPCQGARKRTSRTAALGQSWL